jgi:alpha-L-fucosidase 2
MYKKILYLLPLLFAGCSFSSPVPAGDLYYHFDSPARIWEETLPLGNGRIGLMPDGGIDHESFVLNEISLWSGGRQDADNPNAYYSLGRIRRLLFSGMNDDAQDLMYSSFVCKGEGSGQGNGANVPYGSFQTLGNLFLHHSFLRGNNGDVSDYRRELNISDAIASVSFKKGNALYYREAFTSFHDDIGVIYLASDANNAINFTLGLSRQERYRVSTSGKEIIMQGQLTNGSDGNGMKYAACIRILLPKGGSLLAGDTTLMVQNASEAIVLVGLATDYFSPDPLLQARNILDAAQKKDYPTLKKEHISAYGRLFNRVSFDLGRSGREDLTIPKRLDAFQHNGGDPALACLYFQFGRYLLISSTRPGLLPPNLQGLWANTTQAPWNGDYHLNINLQMNLWPAEACNLSELHLPMIEWTKKQVPSGERTAQVYYNARGWVTHILGNVWEFTAPGEHPSWGATNTSAAWLCEHLYTHYLYTQDTTYLADVYPVMRGAALFFIDMLVQDPRTGFLVSAPTSSPENAFLLNGRAIHTSAGSTMDNQIIRELFTNTIQASEILGIDTALRQEMADRLPRLMPTTIAADGRIMEWLEPREEADIHHRHVSHLYGLHPGNEISVSRTPDLAAAAVKTLEARGDKSTGWSMAWKMNFWARLHDGEHAWRLFRTLLTPAISYTGLKYNGEGGGTAPNLLCMHPPFQIDGNFGATAAIAEMLLQSQSGTIELLPAIPDEWATGRFTGLCVIGGGEVDLTWENHRPLSMSLRASRPYTYTIQLPKEAPRLAILINSTPASLPVYDNRITVGMQPGDELELSF